MKTTTKPKSDYLLQNRSREEAKRNKNIETTQYYAVTANKSSFENNSTLAIKRNHIARKFLELKAKEDEKLEIRKEKLRKLFAADEEQYRVALIKKEETKEERIQRMKERMMELKSRREAERKLIVEEKLNQKWRNECNELKEVESKLIDKEVSAAREEQIRELNQRRQKALEEKKYYDTLWEKDRQKKILREETDKANQKALNEDMLRQLGSQIKQLYEQECEEKRLRDEEAMLQRKQAELQAIEEKRAQVKKLDAQIEIRADLDRFNKEKIRQRAKEIKASLEMDLSIVNDFFKADEKERALKNRKREEARKEMILYREHLKEMKRVEEERERELEKLYQEEEEKVWKIRAEKWKKEQKARDKLMMEVLQGRQEQLRHAMEQNQLRLLENKVEQENIKKSIESARVMDENDKKKVEEKGEIYRTFLNTQVLDNSKIRVENKRRLAAEIQAEKDMHRKFQDLLKQETEKTLERKLKLKS